jgi:hypothetical protein
MNSGEQKQEKHRTNSPFNEEQNSGSRFSNCFATPFRDWLVVGPQTLGTNTEQEKLADNQGKLYDGGKKSTTQQTLHRGTY